MKISFNIYLIPVAIVIYLMGQFELFSIAYFSAFLHEIAHVLIAKRFKLDVKEIEFLPIGFTARIEGAWKLSVKSELILFLSGPMTNLCLFVFSLLTYIAVSVPNNKLLADFISVNIFLACFNMIPAFPFDGGRIFMTLLSLRLGMLKCARLCISISKSINFILLVVGIIVFINTGNFIMIIIICYTLVLIFSDSGYILADCFLYILNKNYSNKTKKVVPVKPLAVTETTCLIRLLREIDRSRFIYAIVFNNDNKIIGTVDENEIIQYILKKGTNAIVGDML